MENCQDEDDCLTPMWCRGKDKCQKQVESDTAKGPLDAAACSALDWRKIAEWLYFIIDDIDTASDHAKGDAAKYREVVEKLQRLRGEVGVSFDGQTITWRNPSEEYGMTRLWHPCTQTPWPNNETHPTGGV
jgi:hypothetical protein